jgi:GT2 family glycosyltransferase
MQSNCCVVVVSYNPASEILVNVNALIGQVAEVLVVDNGSGQESLVFLAELSKKESVL